MKNFPGGRELIEFITFTARAAGYQESGDICRYQSQGFKFQEQISSDVRDLEKESMVSMSVCCC